MHGHINIKFKSCLGKVIGVCSNNRNKEMYTICDTIWGFEKTETITKNLS